jgi:hypothetical protein
VASLITAVAVFGMITVLLLLGPKKARKGTKTPEAVLIAPEAPRPRDPEPKRDNENAKMKPVEPEKVIPKPAAEKKPAEKVEEKPKEDPLAAGAKGEEKKKAQASETLGHGDTWFSRAKVRHAAAALEKFLPDDTQIVASINVRQILDSPLARKLEIPKEIENNIKKDEEATKVLKAMGFDPIKDIHRITFASPETPDLKNWLLGVHGNFDLAKIHDAADGYIKTHGDNVSLSKLDNVRVYEIKDPKKGKTGYACFLSKDVLVVSPTKAYVVDAIAKHAGKREPKFTEAIKDLVSKQDSRQSIWLAALPSTDAKERFVCSFPDFRLFFDTSPTPRELAWKLESISVGVSVTHDIKLNLLFWTSEEKAARNLQHRLEGAKDFGILYVAQAEELKEHAPTIIDILNAFKYKFTEARGLLNGELEIPASVIDKAAGMIKKQ